MKKYLITIIAILVLFTLAACTSAPREVIVDNTATIIDTPIAPGYGPIDLPEEPDAPDKGEDIDPPATPPPHYGEIIEMGGGHSSWRIYDDVAALTGRRSIVVFHGEVLDERPEWFSQGVRLDDPPPGTTAEQIREWYHNIFTVYRVRVIDVFQGDMQPGDIVEVMQEGGERGGFRFISWDEIPISVGEDLIFFARFSSSFPDLPGVFINPYQTVYHFAGFDGRARFEQTMSTELESVYDSHRNIPVTLGDLLTLKFNNFGIDAALELGWVDDEELRAHLLPR